MAKFFEKCAIRIVLAAAIEDGLCTKETAKEYMQTAAFKLSLDGYIALMSRSVLN